MQTLYDKLKEHRFTIIAVAMGETEEHVEKFLKKRPLSFPVMADPDSEIALLYGVNSLPVTFLIDRDKSVIGRAVGPREWESPDLEHFFLERSKVPSAKPAKLMQN